MVAITYLAAGAAAVTSVVAIPASVHVRSPADDHPDFDMSFALNNLTKRQDYNQNYKTGGNVNFQPNNNGYSVSFSGAGDFVVGKGWKTGTSR
jgi:endo-1,4-beta-xylanase